MSERKELSTEMRSLIAAVLCLVVIAAWSLIYKPPQPPPANPAAVTTNPVPRAAPRELLPLPSPRRKNRGPCRSCDHARRERGKFHRHRKRSVSRGDFQSRRRGAKLAAQEIHRRSQTAAHARSGPSPKPLRRPGSWPFSLALDDPQQEAAANNALFEITSAGKVPGAGAVLQAPAEVTLSWSDGHLEVTKQLKFNDSYIVDVKTTASLDGMPLRTSLVWAGGFGDITAYRAAAQTNVFTSAAGKLNTLAVKNLGKPGQTSVRSPVAGTFDFAGIEDLYFAAAFLPPFNARGDLAEIPLTVTGWTYSHETTTDGKTETEIVPQMAAGLATPGPLDVRAYAGPKSVDGLKAVRPPLNSLVQFGWWGFIAEPLFYSLQWLHRYVSNYGWAIVLITIANQHGDVPAESEEHARDDENAEGRAGSQSDSGKVQEIFDARSPQGRNEQGSHGRVFARGHQSAGKLLAHADPDADLVRAVSHAGQYDRASPHALVWLDPRSIGARSVLHFARLDGRFHVFHAENDAHAGDGPCAGQDDGPDAADLRRNVCALSERPVGVYTD